MKFGEQQEKELVKTLGYQLIFKKLYLFPVENNTSCHYFQRPVEYFKINHLFEK